MNNIGSSMFAAAWQTLPDARAEIRVGTDVLRAVTAGRMEARRDTDNGSFDGTTMNVRVEASSESQRNPLNIGRKVEFKHLDADEWAWLRIASRKQVAGVLLLTMEYPDE